jgi:hypothetical protein
MFLSLLILLSSLILYFRFTNRQIAEIFLLRSFFLINFVLCVFLPLLTQQMTLRVAYSNYELILDFLLLQSALPIDIALLEQKRNYIKSKTTAKLKLNRTSIAARCIQDQIEKSK